MIKVVNKSKHNVNLDEDFFIGRGSILGNPYTGSKELSMTKALYQCDSREDAILNYRNYLNEKIESKDEAICAALNKIYLKAKHGNVNLVCYCKPLDCHGDYIKELIDGKMIKEALKNDKKIKSR